MDLIERVRANHVAAFMHIFFLSRRSRVYANECRTQGKHEPKKEKTDTRTWFPLLRAYNARELRSRYVWRLVGFPPRAPGVERSVSAMEKDVEWILRTSRCLRRRRKLLLLPTPRLSLLCPAKISLRCSLPSRFRSRFLAFQEIRNHHHQQQQTLTTPL